jgi:uncharacterized protein
MPPLQPAPAVKPVPPLHPAAPMQPVLPVQPAAPAQAAPPAQAAALQVRSATTFLARLRGLLGRPLPAAGAALLITPCASVHTCFMRAPIDVVFLDHHDRVLRVFTALRPWRLAGCRGARAALELAAGDAARLRLQPGAHVPATRIMGDCGVASPPRPSRRG